MRSLAVAFPDASFLLSLDPEQLAGLFLFHFKGLPWRDRTAVQRCIAHWAEPYPTDDRSRVIDALTTAWERLRAEGLLDETIATVPSSEAQTLLFV